MPLPFSPPNHASKEGLRVTRASESLIYFFPHPTPSLHEMFKEVSSSSQAHSQGDRHPWVQIKDPESWLSVVCLSPQAS